MKRLGVFFSSPFGLKKQTSMSVDSTVTLKDEPLETQTANPSYESPRSKALTGNLGSYW